MNPHEMKQTKQEKKKFECTSLLEGAFGRLAFCRQRNTILRNKRSQNPPSLLHRKKTFPLFLLTKVGEKLLKNISSYNK